VRRFRGASAPAVRESKITARPGRPGYTTTPRAPPRLLASSIAICLACLAAILLGLLPPLPATYRPSPDTSINQASTGFLNWLDGHCPHSRLHLWTIPPFSSPGDIQHKLLAFFGLANHHQLASSSARTLGSRIVRESFLPPPTRRLTFRPKLLALNYAQTF
jgi:hypothetical protein